MREMYARIAATMVLGMLRVCVCSEGCCKLAVCVCVWLQVYIVIYIYMLGLLVFKAQAGHRGLKLTP